MFKCRSCLKSFEGPNLTSCFFCAGSGRDHKGGVCPVCGGTLYIIQADVCPECVEKYLDATVEWMEKVAESPELEHDPNCRPPVLFVNLNI